MRRVAEDPQGRSTLDRSELRHGIHSFQIRHSREGAVANPVHVLFYCVIQLDGAEIVQILHDRMSRSGTLERGR
jgi:toxin ParE1/3/4